MRIAAVSLLVAAALVWAWGCSSDKSTPGGGDAGPPEAGPCPDDLPQSCPSPPPSYAQDVGAIIQSRCNGCHADGGVGQSTEDFSTYDRIHSRRGPMLNQVFSCLMPPPDAGQLTPDERAKLLGWLVCDAPDN